MATKTVKDLRATGVYRSVESPAVKVHNEALDEVKTLAIKWAKEYRMSPFGTFCIFHNITPEDLE